MTTNISDGPITVGGEFDGIVIVDNFQSKRGGASLDVTGYDYPTLYAGHVIIKETSTGTFKPMPVTGEPFDSGSAYATLPSGHTYYGHQIQTVPTNRAMVGILVRGTINPSDSCNPYSLTPILTDLQAAVTDRIDYRADRQ